MTKWLEGIPVPPQDSQKAWVVYEHPEFGELRVLWGWMQIHPRIPHQAWVPFAYEGDLFMSREEAARIEEEIKDFRTSLCVVLRPHVASPPESRPFEDSPLPT